VPWGAIGALRTSPELRPVFDQMNRCARLARAAAPLELTPIPETSASTANADTSVHGSVNLNDSTPLPEGSPPGRSQLMMPASSNKQLPHAFIEPQGTHMVIIDQPPLPFHSRSVRVTYYTLFLQLHHIV